MLGDLSWLKRVKIIDENGNLITEDNPFPVQHIDFRKILWTSDDDFNTGSLIDTEIEGADDSAFLRLLDDPDNDDDIDYETDSEYTLSDSNKLEILNGLAKLKPLTNGDMNWPFNTPANYTYDSDLVEVTGGKAQLIDLRPSDATFYCDYTTSSGNWGDGNLSGSLQNGASVSAGKLNTEGAVGRSCDYDSQLNADLPQIGCCRLGYVPQYSGTPGDYQVMFFLGDDGTFTNSIYLFHDVSGLLYVAMYDNVGSLIMAHNCGSWSPTSGVEYEFEVNWNITAGISRLFIDGTQKGGTATQTGTHDNFDIIRVGNNYDSSLTSNFKINYIIFFDTVQHTANYTPEGEAGLPTTQYSTENPIIVPNTGFGFSTNLETFEHVIQAIAPRDVQYQISSDDGATWEWFNGVSWEEITKIGDSFLATAISTLTGTLDSGNLASIQALDGNTYDVSEVNGSPGYDIRIDFDSTPANVNEVTIYGYYAGNPAHIVDVDIYNFDTSSWDTLGQIPSSAAVITQYDFPIAGTLSDYRDGNGNVDIKIIHTSNGNVNHDIVIDYIFLVLDETPTNSWYYDNETNSETEVDTNIGTLAASGTFKFKAFLHCDLGTGTPSLDNVYIATPITYSTDDNLFIDTKDTSQIAPAIIFSWLTAAITANSLPGSTDIKLMFSVDGRVSWLTYTGNSGNPWEAPVDATKRQYASSITDSEDNFLTLPLGNGTLDVRLFLYTNDNVVTPSVSNINIISDTGFSTSGSFESAVYDSTHFSLDWGIIDFSLVLPSGTSIVITARASNDSGDLGNYGSPLSNGQDSNITGRYIQWKAVFSTSDPMFSAFLLDLALNFTIPTRQEVRP